MKNKNNTKKDNSVLFQKYDKIKEEEFASKKLKDDFDFHDIRTNRK